MDYLKNTEAHPTAEEIYAALKLRVPSISLSTVYRNLAQFEKEGLVTRIQEDNQKAKFDANLSSHEHIVCVSCGRLSDVHLENSSESWTNTTIEGFVVLVAKYRFVGICHSCMTDIRKIIEDNKGVTKTTQFVKELTEIVGIIKDANTWVSIFELAARRSAEMATIRNLVQVGMNLGYVEDDGQERYKFIKS